MLEQGVKAEPPGFFVFDYSNSTPGFQASLQILKVPGRLRYMVKRISRKNDIDTILKCQGAVQANL